MLTIRECCDRYKIASTKTLYTRINGLKSKGIDTELVTHNGKSFIPTKLQNELDSLDRHIKNGGNILAYEPLSKVDVLPPQHNTTTQHDDTTLLRLQSDNQYLVITPELIQHLAIAVAENLKPADPFWHIDRLRMLARFGIQITSSELRSLIGIKPQGDRLTRGSFQFVKTGKIGRESAWVVSLSSLRDEALGSRA